MQTKIKNNEIAYYEGDEKLAYVTLEKVDDNTVNITHTVVSEKLRGQGVASKLMEDAYTYLKSINKKAILTCSYAIKYFEKKQDKKDILK